VSKIQIATTRSLLALTCGICLTGFSAMLAGQNASVPDPPSKDKDVKPADKNASNKDANSPADQAEKMSPLGLVHDFGKVTRGTLCRHAFRVVNTSDAPLQIVSLRIS